MLEFKVTLLMIIIKLHRDLENQMQFQDTTTLVQEPNLKKSSIFEVRCAPLVDTLGHILWLIYPFKRKFLGGYIKIYAGGHEIS